jgi:hypothetical protein
MLLCRRCRRCCTRTAGERARRAASAEVDASVNLPADGCLILHVVVGLYGIAIDEPLGS